MADAGWRLVAVSRVERLPAQEPAPARARAALILMATSGFAALGYQIVWTQQSALWLGHEAAAVFAVVAAFFGGLAVGALLLGARIERSARPAVWYVACECVIALWSLLLIFALAPAGGALLEFTGAQAHPLRQWSIAFGGTFLLLLPATAAMGATLPAMERVLAPLQRSATRIAALYAGNTLGAVLGVLGTAFFLVPAVGLARTSAVCVVLNLLVAAAAFALFVRRRGDGARDAPGAARREPSREAPRATRSAALAMLAATGLLGIGYEVLAVRVLSQVTENTVFTFAMLLAVYLVGTAAGAAAYRRWPVADDAATAARRILLRALAVACVLGALGLAGASSFKTAALGLLGGGLPAALAAEAALAIAAFLAPTIVMGALFSHLATTARRQEIGLGDALGVNTLGAAAAQVIFGVVVLPAFGAKVALLLVAAGYLALSIPTTRAAWRAPSLWTAAAAALLCAAALPSLTIVDVPAGGRVVTHREGALAAVAVVEDASGVARLHINNRQQEGSSATRYADGRQALLPLLLHASPRHALFLGLGTGVTASVAADDPLVHVDAVELLPEVIAASAHFRPASAQTAAAARPRLINADARRFVRAAGARYDVIVADNFHPARSGSGSLYTVEHFAAVRARLADGGLFCQWLPLHQLDLATVRSIVRAFLAVYPDAWALLATHSLDTPVLGLVARENGQRFDANRVQARVARQAAPRAADFGFDDELAVLGSFVAGPGALARFAGAAPLNTDDRPVVAYLAPRITYAPDSRPRDRLVALLHELAVRPEEVLASPPDATWPARLAAYWRARDRFIEIGRDVVPTRDVRQMLAQVREPLLGVLEISPEFRPAHEPLVQMAGALARSDAEAARALLAELQRIQSR